MHRLKHTIIYRLPQYYCWSAEKHCAVVSRDKASSMSDQILIALRLLSHEGPSALEIMKLFQQMLSAIRVECRLLDHDGQPCLFIRRTDEYVTSCCLKNRGVAIAQPLTAC